MTAQEVIKYLTAIRDFYIDEEEEIVAINDAITALEEIQQYRVINKELQEKYHANVDIPLLMHHFVETVFEGEKHEGFYLLTNEDADMWRQYRALGSVEECREAVREAGYAK